MLQHGSKLLILIDNNKNGRYYDDAMEVFTPLRGDPSHAEQVKIVQKFYFKLKATVVWNTDNANDVAGKCIYSLSQFQNDYYRNFGFGIQFDDTTVKYHWNVICSWKIHDQ